MKISPIPPKQILDEQIKGTKGIIKEFQEFIARGNVIDLAVGVVIGAAFTGIVNSLVKDVIMPPIGFLTGQVDFSSLYINLGPDIFTTLADAEAAGAPVIKYGVFLNALINFLIVAIVVFLLVKQVNRLKRKEEVVKQKEEPIGRKCPFCYKEIHEKATRCPHCTSEVG